ncbi:MAG: c-type cytochrome, partial [Myxococcales bacterium]|nr:c-type cytochrome [Myxococcales bacterium]
PDDADGDGISGRVNRVWNPRVGAMTVGRFGWKANTADLAAQTAGAYLNDMGVSSQYAPDDDGSWELADDVVADTTFYVQTLAVPAPHDLGGADVARGERAFRQMGCDGCHTPTLETGPHEIGALAGQRFHPYTDLLLHDMGEGLADGRPDFEATGREWRTPPLWGLGLTRTVSDHERLLHDGRARGVAEAVLWHGGEAEASREAFRTASAADREALLAFLRSL